MPVENVAVHQYIADKATGVAPEAGTPGLSLASVDNDSPIRWKGDVRVMYPAFQRAIGLRLSHPALRSPLAARGYSSLPGPLCSGCSHSRPRTI